MTNSKEEMISINRTNADIWAMKLKENPDSVLQIDGVVVPLVYLREEELWEIFHKANPDTRNVSVMRKALKTARIGAPTHNQIRCEGYGKLKLRAVRPVTGQPTDAEIGRTMVAERQKWLSELKREKYGGYSNELMKIFGLPQFVTTGNAKRSNRT